MPANNGLPPFQIDMWVCMPLPLSCAIGLGTQVAAAESVGRLVTQLQGKTASLHAALKKAGTMHDEPVRCAAFLTSAGADAMAAAREASDRLELVVGDAYWPLPRYREILFPV